MLCALAQVCSLFNYYITKNTRVQYRKSVGTFYCVDKTLVNGNCMCYSSTKREHTLSKVTVCVTVEQKGNILCQW